MRISHRNTPFVDEIKPFIFFTTKYDRFTTIIQTDLKSNIYLQCN